MGDFFSESGGGQKSQGSGGGNQDGGSGLKGAPVGMPDPTGTMPVQNAQSFGLSPVESLSPAECKEMWGHLTNDPEGLFSNMPRSVFNAYRNALFAKGFQADIDQQAKDRQQKTKEFVDSELQKRLDYDDENRYQRAVEKSNLYFGSSEVSDQMRDQASELLKKIGTEVDRDFMAKTNMDLDPFVIHILAILNGYGDQTHESLRKFGIGKFLAIGGQILRDIHGEKKGGSNDRKRMETKNR